MTANLHVILYEPEIPPNTGNIIRLCANTNCQLHLIHPLGFEINNRQLKRAGLDYHELTQIKTYDSWENFIQLHKNKTIYACTTKTKNQYHRVCYQPEDMLLFGPETRGLPVKIRQQINNNIRIPMAYKSRSLNLANSVSIIVYEALRQLDFPNLDTSD